MMGGPPRGASGPSFIPETASWVHHERPGEVGVDHGAAATCRAAGSSIGIAGGAMPALL